MNKTVNEWLRELPQKYEDAVRANGISERCLNLRKDSLLNAFYETRLWETGIVSKEGKIFWTEVYYSIRDSKEFPEFPGPETAKWDQMNSRQREKAAKAFVKLALDQIHPREIRQFIRKTKEQLSL